MDEKLQDNRKHFKESSGRKTKENDKSANKAEKIYLKDSKGSTIIKRKRTIDRVNQKAFAIRSINKTKKSIAYAADKQTKKHTFTTTKEESLEAPLFVSIMGSKNSGKSTLLRTLSRHYLKSIKKIEGPLTIVTSKNQRVTFYECPMDLPNTINAVKVSDMVLYMINITEGVTMEFIELISLINNHGKSRVRIIFTHLDEFVENNGAKLFKTIREITKNVNRLMNVETFKLSLLKKFRKNNLTEYKIEEVRNLARMITDKKPLPNEWRSNHAAVIVDRIEKFKGNEGHIDDYFERIKLYGYVRGSVLSADNLNLHFDGVGDIVVENVQPIDDPCPCMQQETKTDNVKLSVFKERKAYAPFCGLGGVIKDDDGIHVLGLKGDHEVNPEYVDEINKLTEGIDEDDQSDEDYSDDNEPETKRQKCDDESNVLSVFQDMEELTNKSNAMSNIQYDLMNGNLDAFRKNDDSDDDKTENESEDESDIDGESTNVNDEKLQMDCNKEIKEQYSDEMKEESDNEDDEEKIDEDDEEDMMEESDDDEDIEEEESNSEGMKETAEDDSEEAENNSEEAEDDSEEEVDDIDNDEWHDKDDNISEFKKKKLERLARSKKDKKAEKRALKTAQFNQIKVKMIGENPIEYFEKWKQSNENQEQQNKQLKDELKDIQNAHKITGVAPGKYVCLTIQKVPVSFYKNFKPSRLLVLGALSAPELNYKFHEATFKIYDHFDSFSVVKAEDPLCLSIGWRRIQTLMHFYTVTDDHKNRHLKYSSNKYRFCHVCFWAPATPVGTAFAAFVNFLPHKNFRIVASGCVKNVSDSVNIVKKIKFTGKPVKVQGKTAFIDDMFPSSEWVSMFHKSQLKTTAKIRGCIDAPCSSNNKHGFREGCFRAKFEAPISMADIVFMIVWEPIKLLDVCCIVGDLCRPDYEYMLPANHYLREKGLEYKGADPNSAYPSEPIHRKEFVGKQLKLKDQEKKKLPFKERAKLGYLPTKPTDLVDEHKAKISKLIENPTDKKKREFLDRLKADVDKKAALMDIRRKEHKQVTSNFNKYVEAKKAEKDKERKKGYHKRKQLKGGNKGPSSKK